MYRLPTDVLRYIYQMDPTYREQYKLVMAELTLNERHAVFECYQHKKEYACLIDGPTNREIKYPYYGCQHYYCRVCIIQKLVKQWLDCVRLERPIEVECPRCHKNVTGFVSWYVLEELDMWEVEFRLSREYMYVCAYALHYHINVA